MNVLADRHIVLGVTGGIAVYKAVEITSRLKKLGAHVHVVMTKEATAFVTERLFQEISGEAVVADMWAKTAFHVEHIALARLADVMLIAPATANILAKAAAGIADDMLSTTILATTAPVFYAPAMNTNMYENPVTQENIERLKARGAQIIEPATGVLACGVEGKGRLPEPAAIVAVLENFFRKKQTLAGKKILVTAGGTVEPLDPVRYLGNRSTGRMGYAVAEAAALRGADVVLVSGPTALQVPTGVRHIPVESARDMHDAVLKEFESADAVVKAAAVADYRPARVAVDKIKKKDGELQLTLVRNPDILKELGEKKQHQILMGFAAETQNVEAYAKGKLEKKNLDFIVANDVSKKDAGFGVDTNCIIVFSREGNKESYPLMKKRELADILLDKIEEKLSVR